LAKAVEVLIFFDALTRCVNELIFNTCVDVLITHH